MVAVSINEFNWIHMLYVDHVLNTTTLILLDSSGNLGKNVTKHIVGNKYFLTTTY